MEGDRDDHLFWMNVQLPKLNKYCLEVELAPAHQVVKNLKMDHLWVYPLYPAPCRIIIIIIIYHTAFKTLEMPVSDNLQTCTSGLVWYLSACWIAPPRKKNPGHRSRFLST